jgi:hypothetical protein
MLAVILLSWLPGVRAALLAPIPRPWEPYQALVERLESWAQPGDLVLLRAPPSGVVGVARYLKHDISLASWVTQLGTREVPADLELLLRGRRRVALATIHDLGPDERLEPWLLAHARLFGREKFRSSRAEVLYFGAANGEDFFPGQSQATR